MVPSGTETNLAKHRDRPAHRTIVVTRRPWTGSQPWRVSMYSPALHHLARNARRKSDMGTYECCGPYGMGRRFTTKAERIERLKEYQDALKKEVQAVEERMEEIEKA